MCKLKYRKHLRVKVKNCREREGGGGRNEKSRVLTHKGGLRPEDRVANSILKFSVLACFFISF